LKDQAEFFAKALGQGNAYRTPNEVRGAFDLNPRPDGNDLPKQSSKPAPKPKEDEDD
jgi:hypothetical protein